jgi:hypothetical protein
MVAPARGIGGVIKNNYKTRPENGTHTELSIQTLILKDLLEIDSTLSS